MHEENHLPRRARPAHPEPQNLVNHPTVVFLTVCTQARKPLLANDRMHDLIVDIWAGATAWVVGNYVIMPDHTHLFVAPGQPSLPLANWVRFWKSQFTKRLGEAIWQADYWDTMMRTGDGYQAKWEYVRENPVRAGLVQRADDWPFRGELNHFRW